MTKKIPSNSETNAAAVLRENFKRTHELWKIDLAHTYSCGLVPLFGPCPKCGYELKITSKEEN
jgi:hypothetical protein